MSNKPTFGVDAQPHGQPARDQPHAAPHRHAGDGPRERDTDDRGGDSCHSRQQAGPRRRRELLAWDGELVIEDDYDAEYRYDRAPVPALHPSAPERIAYAGSTSKTLAPALRLGWLVAPRPHPAGPRPAPRQAGRAARRRR
ncbi:hypothetical protein [Mycolicibacterium smegmatis]|uniref:hypothetical protein n=1 Tax=Mycolicibacterium smegmatis TaxID=1772 RepID=UPI0005DA185F|nr:GntR family transcriptional regulator [Mycolicibacterium smegmatis]